MSANSLQALARMPVDEIKQFVVHSFSGLRAFFDGVGSAVFQVIVQQMAAGSSRSFLNGGNLQQNVCAISLLRDHFFESPYLSGYPCEPAQSGCLDLRIYANSLAVVSAGTISRAGFIVACCG